jgi:hypothetical protein
MKNSGKKKVNKVIYMAIGVVIIAAIIVVPRIVKNEANKHILDGPGMINHRAWDLAGVSYSEGGGMNGGHHYMEIRSDDGGKLIYEYSHLAYIGAEEETLVKEIDESELECIREICKNTNCLIYYEGTPSEFQLLDAPVTNINFTLYDGSTVSFNSNYEYGANCNGLFSMVYDELIRIYDAEKL